MGYNKEALKSELARLKKKQKKEQEIAQLKAEIRGIKYGKYVRAGVRVRGQLGRMGRNVAYLAKKAQGSKPKKKKKYFDGKAYADRINNVFR